MGYLKDSYNMSIKPLLNFASPVITPIGNFLTSGSNYNPNESAASNFTTSFTTPSNLFDDTFMSDNMDLTYGGGDVPKFDGLGPITIKGGPENIIQGQNNGMTSAQKEALTSMGSYNAFNANKQINPAGTSSPDGMMTMPTLPLYPGEAIGIDGVPYRPSAGQNNNPSSYSYEPNQGGSAAASATPVADVLGTRQFNQRTPSGSVYAPDMSAYNNSSLFNYEGPGGVSEYTYGQGLPTDGAAYSIFGSPADAANPYFAGQFATPTGPADAAINMNPVIMPAGVPAISSGGTTTANPLNQGKYVGNPNHSNSGQDLSYQQTIDSMGIFGPNNPPPSTIFSSPGQAATTSSLADRIRTQMGNDNYQAMVDRANAMDKQLQNQINTNREVAAIAGAPAMDDTADVQAGMPTMPTDMQKYLDDFEARGITDRTQQIMDYATQNNNMIDGITIFNEGDPRQVFQDAILNPQSETENKPIYGGLDGIPLNDSFMMSDGPSARNTGKPFVPEGTEGVDYYQDVTGNFFNMEDDLGTQALGPVPDMMSSGPDGRGARGNSSRPLTEAELAPDTGELTSGDMGALDDAMTAIDAKYAGSTTTASQQAELSEIVNSIAMAYGSSSRGSKGDSVSPAQAQATADAVNAVDNQLMNQLDSRPVYAREQEGTDMAESLFQGVAPVAPTNTGYPGANSTPFNPSNPIDQVVLQQIAQDAQIARAKYEAPAPAPVSVPTANAASLFNYGPPNMQQVKPMVAKTQNNMTVPVMRDARMDRRYGGPYGF